MQLWIPLGLCTCCSPSLEWSSSSFPHLVDLYLPFTGTSHDLLNHKDMSLLYTLCVSQILSQQIPHSTELLRTESKLCSALYFQNLVVAQLKSVEWRYWNYAQGPVESLANKEVETGLKSWGMGVEVGGTQIAIRQKKKWIPWAGCSGTRDSLLWALQPWKFPGCRHFWISMLRVWRFCWLLSLMAHRTLTRATLYGCALHNLVKGINRI